MKIYHAFYTSQYDDRDTCDHYEYITVYIGTVLAEALKAFYKHSNAFGTIHIWQDGIITDEITYSRTETWGQGA